MTNSIRDTQRRSNSSKTYGTDQHFGFEVLIFYFKEDQDYTFNDPFENDKYEDFSVNPMAESTLDIVAKIILIFGAAVGVLIWIASFMSDEPLHMIVGFIAGLIAFFLQGLLPWACIKVVLNMSCNLHAIRQELHELKNRN